jgi:hypothetical protein
LLAARRSDPTARGTAGQVPALLPGLTNEVDGRIRAMPYELPAYAADDPGPQATDPIARLRELIAERQSESIDALRHWVEDKNGPAPKG